MSAYCAPNDAEPNHGMHPTHLNGAFMLDEARGRVMPGVRRLPQTGTYETMNNETQFCDGIAERYPEFVKDPHSWAAMVELYRDDVENWRGSIHMLCLVEHLVAQEYALLFTPGTSLMALCVSAAHSDARQPDSLVVRYDNSLNLYRLDYYEGGSMKPEKRLCGEREVRGVIETKLLRLKLASG